MSYYRKCMPFYDSSIKYQHISLVKVYLICLFAYFVSNCGILFVHGVFWDDWCLYENPIGIHQILEGIGAEWKIPIHVCLLELSHQIGMDVVNLYRLIILILGFFNVIFYIDILRHLKIENSSVIWITLLFASWPLGFAHMLMCCFGYQLGLFLQLLTICVFLRTRIKCRIFGGVLVCIFEFFASLCLPSVILLWLGFLLYMALSPIIRCFDFSGKYIKFCTCRMVKYLVYFFPCVLYWIVKNIFMKSTGLYASEGYNTFSLMSLVQLPLNLVKCFNTSILFEFKIVYIVFGSLILFSLFFFIFLIVTFLLRNVRDSDNGKYLKIKVIICLYFFTCGIAAYLLVDKVYVFDDVADRHAILSYLGFCPLLYYFVHLLHKKKEYVRLVLLFFVCLSCTYSIIQYTEAIRLSQRNDAIVQFFCQNELPQGNVIVCEKNPTIKSNFYSWSGLYNKATGKQDRYFLCVEDGKMYDDNGFRKTMYHQSDATFGEPTIAILFFQEETSKSISATLKRMYYYYTNKTKYNQSLLNSFIISYKSLRL